MSTVEEIIIQEKSNCLNCKYCNRKCKNLNSLRQHETRCKDNPNRKDFTKLTEYVIANLKGKTAENCLEIAQHKQVLLQLYAEGKIKSYGFPKFKEYVYVQHNEQEIEKWLRYLDSQVWEIPIYNANSKIDGYSFLKTGFVHNLVANILLKGNLQKQNAVHHINKIREDNSPKNLMIFKNSAVHKRFHTSKYAFLIYDENTYLFDCYLK